MAGFILPQIRALRRNLLTVVINQFRGMNIFNTAPLVPPNFAISSENGDAGCLNVICSSTGGLEKLRVPVAVTAPQVWLPSGPSRIFDFQQAKGTRHLLAAQGADIGYFDVNAAYNPALIDSNVLNNSLWDFVTSNNLGFAANGQRMMKWTGTNWWGWGIMTPLAPPAFGITLNLISIQRATGVVTAIWHNAGATMSVVPLTGDVVTIAGVSDATFDGTFAIASATWVSGTGYTTITFNQAGADAGPLANGSATIYRVPASIPVPFASRANNVSTITVTYVDGTVFVGQYVTITGMTDTTFNGTFKVISAFGVGTSYITFQQNLPDVASHAETGTVVVGNADNGNLLWAYAYGNSSTGHVGTASPATAAFPSLYAANSVYYLTAALPSPEDTQIDTIFWYRTLSGGADLYLVGTYIIGLQIRSITRHSNVWTVHYTTPANLVWNVFDLSLPLAAITISGCPDPSFNGNFIITAVGGTIDDPVFIFSHTAPDASTGAGFARITADSGSASSGAVGPTLFDSFSDGDLNLAVRAQYINDPPLVGKYLAKFQGRVFIFNLQGNPQDIIYSGMERIFTGRPEEAFPPGNRLRLATGADAIRGGGVIQAGVVAFDDSNHMYMFRGIVEDITVTAPPLIGAYLEELPWKLGAASHYSIASTPLGLVWLASDNTVRVYNGTNMPSDVSWNVKPILRSITPGQAANARGAYYQWLDRQWYILTFAINGSLSNNVMMFFDMNPDPAANVGIFMSDQGADDISVVEDSNGQRMLLMSKGGKVYQMKVASKTWNGVTFGLSSTAGVLEAYWRGGYIGSDSPQTYKTFRFARIESDQEGFTVTARLVDGRGRKFGNPEIKQATQNSDRYTINGKARRCSVEIGFPPQDTDVSLIELSVGYVPTGDR